MTALDQVPRGEPRARDLVDREGVVGIAAGRLERHVRHVDRQLRERVEHADLRRDPDEALDALRGEVQAVGDRARVARLDVRGAHPVAGLAGGRLDRGDARRGAVVRARGREDPIVHRLVSSPRRSVRRVLQLGHHVERAASSLGADAGVVVEHAETVWCETPARRATSRMLGARPRVDSRVGSGTVTSIDSGMFTVTHAAATIMHGYAQNVTVTM